MAYIVVPIDEPNLEPFWTIRDVSGSVDLRNAHRYLRKVDAEKVADLMNGVEPEQVSAP